MRVFVTGATGWIGSAVVQELLGAGHRVLELARSDASAASLAAAGAEVHRGSLADLDSLENTALAVESAPHGTRLHGAGEEGVPMRDIAQAIGEGLGVPVRSLTEEEAGARFGGMANFVALANPTSSALTRDSLGWNPTQIELLTDMRDNGYFSV